MVRQPKFAEGGNFLREGARDLPSNATWMWGRARVLGAGARSRAVTWISAHSRTHSRSLDVDDMTKDELMALARKEDVSGRSSMTKDELAAALRTSASPDDHETARPREQAGEVNAAAGGRDGSAREPLLLELCAR
jgi:hypothetical protein